MTAGLIALGGLIGPAASFAAAPATGNSCVASDGKINGRGATYQTISQTTFLQGYRDDFCGPVTSDSVAADAMVAYNYPAAVSGSGTGSGNGIKATSCRTDAFAGSDLPYNQTQLGQMNGAPGATGGCTLSFSPPFAPVGPTFPNASDSAAPVMSFPVAGSSVALAVNLSAAACGGTKPTSVSFTPAQVTAILGGNVAMWNDASLTSNNSQLANCNIAIQRVVRFDNSGTTGILKNYLIRIDDSRNGASCASGTTWTSYNGSPNTSWPSGTGCTAVLNGGASGAPALIAKLQATDGGIGYADLADTNGKGLVLASVQNATGTAFTSPRSGSAANCDYSVLTLPGATPSDAVGLNTGDNWGNDNQTVNSPNPSHMNATDLGSKYPICGITFALVYSGLSSTASPNPISSLSADQRRTLYSYETYILSSAAQDRLANVLYASLPAAWLGKLRSGFQSNF